MSGLRALCSVADTGSFSAAATALGVTQSAVSQQVAALEQQVGQTLVLRGSRPAELTRAGLVLAEHGRAVLLRLSAAERDLADVVAAGGRHLRLGCFPTALATFVPAAMARLRRELPDVVVSVTDDHMQGLPPRLRDRELDVAVVFTAGGPDADPALGEDLVVTPLFTDPYRLLLPRGHRLAANPQVRLSDLRAVDWVGGGARSTWFAAVRAACLAEGFEPRTALATDDYLAVQSFVAAGLGVALVPGLAARRTIPGVVAKDPVSRAPVRRIAVARPAGRFVPDAVARLTRILREQTGD